MSKVSPVQRTLKLLRDKGYFPWIVERWIPFPYGRRIDLYHIGDVLAISTDETLLVQICGNDYAAHYRKITIEYRDNALEWLANPHRKLILHGWRKLLVKRGGKAKTWTPRVHEFAIADFDLPKEITNA